MASNILGHHNMVAVANETNSTMNKCGHTSAPRRIQPTLQPIAQQTLIMQAGMQHIMHGTTTTPVPVPFALKYWITSIGKLLPKDEYITSAIILACMLVKCLIQMVASTNMPPEEFSTEKVIVFVQQDASNFLFKEVQFYFETRGALFPLPLHSTSFQVVSGGSPLQPCTCCALLGNVVLLTGRSWFYRLRRIAAGVPLVVVMATGNLHDYQWINEDHTSTRRTDTRAHSRS